MAEDNVKAQMRKGILEYCILAILSRGDSYAPRIIAELKAAEMIVVTPFFMSGALFTPEQLANGFVTSVVLLVGLGTVIHSMLDYSISILIWKPVSLAVPRSTQA